MRLLLIRHAQTASNIGRALDTAPPGPGLTGTALTGLGVRQAERLAGLLAGEPLEAVAASPLLRAQQTARPVAAARGLAVTTLDGLREIEAGELEMATSAEAIAWYRDVVTAWAAGDLGVVMPGGTSGHEFLDRFDAAVRSAAAAGATVAAVSHGGAIRTWAAIRCRGAGPAAVSGRALGNTGMLIIEGMPGGWRLAGWREEVVEDLPATGLTDAGGGRPAT